MVLAASGVEHEELLKYAEPLLADLPGGALAVEPKSVYVGGDHRVMANTGVCFLNLNVTLIFFVLCH